MDALDVAEPREDGLEVLKPLKKLRIPPPPLSRLSGDLGAVKWE